MISSTFTVRWEEEDFIIVEKPYRLHTAPLQPGAEDNLLTLVIKQYPEVSTVPGKKNIEPGLLHRLDFETSGLVIIARTVKAFKVLSEQFAANQVKKDYFAISLFYEPQLKGSPRECSLPEWKKVCQSVSPLESGKAETYTVKSSFKPRGPGQKLVKVVQGDLKYKKKDKVTSLVYTSQLQFLERTPDFFLLQVSLTKGFRHQVRAHLAYLGMPIVGDPLYNEADFPACPARMFLHAAGLHFFHPLTGEAFDFTTPVPEDFRQLLQNN
jgi:23S rRNA pseudouridine1911/1915/1917 synthase